jgi:hypothetical protein
MTPRSRKLLALGIKNTSTKTPAGGADIASYAGDR